MPATATARAVCWLQPTQVELVRAVVEQAGLVVTAAGCPQRGRALEVAGALSVPGLDDLRHALASAEAEVVLIASDGGAAAAAGPEDLQALRACAARGVHVLSMEPLPASVLQLAGGGGPAVAGNAIEPVTAGEAWARFVPLARRSRRVRDALDLREHFGPVRSASIRAFSTPAEGSLGARLFDAMDLLLAVMGEPLALDASYVAPVVNPALHPTPGETLADLQGDLHVSARFPDGRAASLAVSNHAGRWARSLVLLGDRGRISATDDGLEWLAPDGARVDGSRRRRTAREVGGAPASVTLIVDEVRRVLDRRGVSDERVDALRVLALCQAALLSARTGEGESPSTILRIVGAA